MPLLFSFSEDNLIIEANRSKEITARMVLQGGTVEELSEVLSKITRIQFKVTTLFKCNLMDFAS